MEMIRIKVIRKEKRKITMSGIRKANFETRHQMSMLSRPLHRILRAPQLRWASNVQVVRDTGLPDLIITPLAAQKIIEAAERQKNNNLMLRVAVEGGGCSGFQYVIEFEKDTTPDVEEDVVFEQNGGKVVVDKESLELIRGSTLDFEEELIRSAFAVINNPNAVSGCGCGTSFDLKE
ncbi:hypothetical protein CCR75_001801 [Bremia lactucae]|uniref:Core domain-containing protein n=1 Tax=Bremia lactucae TaxID=4779 RepID=A0A976FR50_BRELC|nr:hypothetical protein CCR75_001801 [Bremia lactucae]